MRSATAISYSGRMIPADDEDETLAEILEVTLTWRLTEAEWETVRQELVLLAGARAGADPKAAARAAEPLIDRAGSRAASGLADAKPDASRQSAPSEVREVVYRLLQQVGLPTDTSGARDDGSA
jgi:hypothetical protein